MTTDHLSRDKQRMLRTHLKGRGITDPAVLGAMAQVDRALFVSPAYRDQAYNDGPLPIGAEQTISQPYIVALMTQQLKLDRHCSVLELGTGSGYQTAILARLAHRVYTIERIPELAHSARALLTRLGIENVEYFVGDGSYGWPPDRLPKVGGFDRIIITAAVPQLPGPVFEQLTPTGRLVAPVGGPNVQKLMSCEKSADQCVESFICNVRFVKLIGDHGFDP